MSEFTTGMDIAGQRWEFVEIEGRYGERFSGEGIMRMFFTQSRFRINSEWSDYIVAGKKMLLNYEDCKSVHNFEHAIEQAHNAKYAICTPRARVAIFIAIKSLMPDGGEVILSPNTIADVINMVICAGAKPVFCDIDPATGNLDPERVAERISPATRMILVTHIYGLMAPMDSLRELTRRHNLLLVEDAAQAFGARQNGIYAGSGGDAGIYSFGMAKNLMAFQGGMLVTNHDDLAVTARNMLAQWPVARRIQLAKQILSCLCKDVATINPLFSHLLFPIFRIAYRKNIHAITRLMETELDLNRKTTFPVHYKERISGVQACVALKKIERVQRDFEHRLACARIYYEGLKDLPSLTLPPMLEDGSHVYNYYPIGCDERVDLRMHMLNKNCDAALQHMKNTADLPAFKDFYSDCPHARRWANRTIMLPNYSRCSFEQVHRNIVAIRDFMDTRK